VIYITSYDWVGSSVVHEETGRQNPYDDVINLAQVAHAAQAS
jgi:hypothetical protein